MPGAPLAVANVRHDRGLGDRVDEGISLHCLPRRKGRAGSAQGDPRPRNSRTRDVEAARQNLQDSLGSALGGRAPYAHVSAPQGCAIAALRAPARHRVPKLRGPRPHRARKRKHRRPHGAAADDSHERSGRHGALNPERGRGSSAQTKEPSLRVLRIGDGHRAAASPHLSGPSKQGLVFEQKSLTPRPKRPKTLGRLTGFPFSPKENSRDPWPSRLRRRVPARGTPQIERAEKRAVELRPSLQK